MTKSILSRVHLHSHDKPNGRAYIVGDREGLIALAVGIERAARGMVGLETINVYSSDGHPYQIMIVNKVSEQEWQLMPVPYDSDSNPSKIESVTLYDSLKEKLATKD
jgi:hypothetical protein